MCLRSQAQRQAACRGICWPKTFRFWVSGGRGVVASSRRFAPGQSARQVTGEKLKGRRCVADLFSWLPILSISRAVFKLAEGDCAGLCDGLGGGGVCRK